MGYSTGNSLRKKSKTKKQEERSKRLAGEKTTARRKQNKFDRLNVMK